MANKEFSLGFVLSATMNSAFTTSFARASKSIDGLEKYMNRLGEEGERVKKAFESGIINQKTFDASVFARQQKNMMAWKNASASLLRQTFADWNILYFKTMAVANVMSSPIQAAMKFESTMADVRKVMDFDTPEQFNEMGKDILELSKNIPMTAEGKISARPPRKWRKPSKSSTASQTT